MGDTFSSHFEPKKIDRVGRRGQKQPKLGIFEGKNIGTYFDHFYGAGRGGDPPPSHSAGRGGEPPPPRGAGRPSLADTTSNCSQGSRDTRDRSFGRGIRLGNSSLFKPN